MLLVFSGSVGPLLLGAPIVGQNKTKPQGQHSLSSILRENYTSRISFFTNLEEIPPPSEWIYWKFTWVLWFFSRLVTSIKLIQEFAHTSQWCGALIHGMWIHIWWVFVSMIWSGMLLTEFVETFKQKLGGGDTYLVGNIKWNRWFHGWKMNRHSFLLLFMVQKSGIKMASERMRKDPS